MEITSIGGERKRAERTMHSSPIPERKDLPGYKNPHQNRHFNSPPTSQIIYNLILKQRSISPEYVDATTTLGELGYDSLGAHAFLQDLQDETGISTEELQTRRKHKTPDDLNHDLELLTIDGLFKYLETSRIKKVCEATRKF